MRTLAYFLLTAITGQAAACATGADAPDRTPAEEVPEALSSFTEAYNPRTLDTGHWALTTNDSDPRVIESSGGDPGGYLYGEVSGPIPTWSTASSRLSGGGDTVFVGDYRASRVGQIGVDLNVEQAGSWSASRTITLQLIRWDTANDTIDLEATYSQPDMAQMPQGWQHYVFPVNAGAAAIPAGWQLSHGDGTPGSDADWATLMQQIDVAAFGLWKPGYEYPALGSWKLGIDNVHIGS